MLALSGFACGILVWLAIVLMRDSRSFKLKIVRAVVIIAVLWLAVYVFVEGGSIGCHVSFFILSTLCQRLFSLNGLSAVHNRFALVLLAGFSMLAFSSHS